MKPPMLSFSSSFVASNMLLFIYVIIPFWCNSSEAVVQLPPNVTVPAIIAFGDSIVDQGNNNNILTLLKCNFPPYGKDFMGGLATGRFTNGKTPLDMLATELGIKEFVPAYKDPNLQNEDLPTGVSFASGGSGYDPQTSTLASVLSLSDQLEMFKGYIGKLKGLVGEERTSYILSNSLFIVVAVSNDLAGTYFTVGTRKLQYNVTSYADFLVTLASDFIKKIYELGARRIGVTGAPPIGCLPAQRTLAGGILRICREDRNQVSKLYNIKLSSMLASLRNNLTQSNVVYIDIYSSVLDSIQNPQNYGLDVVDRGCCGTGIGETAFLCNRLSGTCINNTKYFFWDSYHPTEHGYKIIVDQVINIYTNSLF